MVMLKRIAAPLALVVALACAGPVLAADPTVDQVYQAARSGHLDEAQQLMNQVLRDHPNSAKAHYVEAELSARAGNLGRAREELANAQRLDPSGAFAKPEALAELQRQLARGESRGPTGYYRTAPVAQERRASFAFWPVILLVVAGVVIAWALLSRRNQPPQYGQYGGQYPRPGGMPGAGPGGGYGAPAGYGPGYGPPAGGGMGSGIVGGLASGLAIGAGVAAGEELVHHFTDRDGNRVEAPPGYVPPPDDNGNMGGNDFGVSDGGNSWDDNGGSFGGGDSGGGDGGGGGGGDWT
jgi:hypothetical protein